MATVEVVVEAVVAVVVEVVVVLLLTSSILVVESSSSSSNSNSRSRSSSSECCSSSNSGRTELSTPRATTSEGLGQVKALFLEQFPLSTSALMHLSVSAENSGV